MPTHDQVLWALRGIFTSPLYAARGNSIITVDIDGAAGRLYQALPANLAHLEPVLHHVLGMTYQPRGSTIQPVDYSALSERLQRILGETSGETLPTQNRNRRK